MSQKIRVILCVACGLLILSAPLLVSSPSLLSEVKWAMTEELDSQGREEPAAEEEEVELDFGRLLFSGAYAEEADENELIEETLDDRDSDLGPAVYELPLNFSIPPAPKEANYTEKGYEDETIRVTLEDREADGVLWHLAFVQIASPSQLRTATRRSSELDELYGSASEKELEKKLKAVLTSDKTASVSGMARQNHAVAAINGDNFQRETEKKTFEYRMTAKIRSKTNQTKDMLIIDENGDFHLVTAQPSKQQSAALAAAAEGHQIVNAFTFGPALVIDGEEQTINQGYGYNPNRPEPRSAIGQIGHLNYVMVIAEGRGASAGVNFQNLAHFMAELGCVQAFNLDGGNSAEMVVGDKVFKGMPGGDERGLNDIIYFATALPED